MSSPNTLVITEGTSTETESAAKIVGKLECPICLCKLKWAVITDCGHTFCRVCIEKSLTTKYECPFCRKKINKAKPFAKNYIVRELLDDKGDDGDITVEVDEKVKDIAVNSSTNMTDNSVADYFDHRNNMIARITNGQTTLSNNRQETLSEQAKKICTICYHNLINIMLPCGHSYCTVCVSHITKCVKC